MDGLLALLGAIGDIFTEVEISGERTMARRVVLGCLTILFMLVGGLALACWFNAE
jgi:hypothetical protein